MRQRIGRDAVCRIQTVQRGVASRAGRDVLLDVVDHALELLAGRLPGGRLLRGEIGRNGAIEGFGIEHVSSFVMYFLHEARGPHVFFTCQRLSMQAGTGSGRLAKGVVARLEFCARGHDAEQTQLLP